MKMRIKYMYEKGDSSYLNLLLEARSLSELLNRAEYVSKISEYDRKMLRTSMWRRKSPSRTARKAGDGEGRAAGDEDADGGKAGFSSASPE